MRLSDEALGHGVLVLQATAGALGIFGLLSFWERDASGKIVMLIGAGLALAGDVALFVLRARQARAAPVASSPILNFGVAAMGAAAVLFFAFAGLCGIGSAFLSAFVPASPGPHQMSRAMFAFQFFAGVFCPFIIAMSLLATRSWLQQGTGDERGK